MKLNYKLAHKLHGEQLTIHTKEIIYRDNYVWTTLRSFLTKQCHLSKNLPKYGDFDKFAQSKSGREYFFWLRFFSLKFSYKISNKFESG